MKARGLIPLLAAVAVFSNAAAAMIGKQAVLDAMNGAGRLPSDIRRDAQAKPEIVIPLLELEPGDTVADIFAGGGYYSELLARVLGGSGRVFLHNSPGFEQWGITELTERFDRRQLGNIVRRTPSRGQLDLGTEALDAALIVMALHDLYVVPKKYDGKEYVAIGKAANAQAFLGQIFKALRPGGRLVVVDHAGDPKSNNEAVAELHRIKETFAVDEMKKSGFVFLRSVDGLRNSHDDRSAIVFDFDKGETDQFILVFAKPDK